MSVSELPPLSCNTKSVNNAAVLDPGDFLLPLRIYFSERNEEKILHRLITMSQVPAILLDPAASAATTTLTRRSRTYTSLAAPTDFKLAPAYTLYSMVRSLLHGTRNVQRVTRLCDQMSQLLYQVGE